ncbi:hypothetical protein ACHAWX_000977, partial [Stephanocyclus meneghinianus]
MQLRPSLVLGFGLAGPFLDSFSPAFAKLAGLTDEDSSVHLPDPTLAGVPLSVQSKLTSTHLPRHDSAIFHAPTDQSLGITERFHLAEEIAE